MKFREGSTVEVLRRENGLHGSWFCGNIIAVDGDEYLVKYKLLMDEGGEAVVERVQKEDIRPQPLHQKGKRWMIGDVAEVFDIRCWRLGKVAKVFKNNRLVIKFFGSVQLKEFHASNLRIQQAWHANKWSVIMKVQNNKQEAGNFRHKTSRQSSSLVCNAPQQPTTEETCSADQKYRHNNLGVCTPSRTIKKGRPCCPEPSSGDLVLERILKKRTSGSDTGGCQRPCTRNHPLFRQVGHSTSPHVDEERKTVNKSTDIDSKIEKGTKNRIHNSFQPQCTEDSYQCSIGSCNSNPNAGCPTGSSDKLVGDSSNSSDAESIFPALSSKKHLSGHKLKVDIHKLELEAYRSIVQALHASGPLSWEQESLLTNLRLSLHISNEEHLLQLRHLLSAQVA